MTQISEPQAFELIRRLLQSGKDYRADMIICMRPMCQLNLDAYQGRVNNDSNSAFHIPALFFTQLLGIALGIGQSELGIGKKIVPAAPVLQDKLNSHTACGTERAAHAEATGVANLVGSTVESKPWAVPRQVPAARVCPHCIRAHWPARLWSHENLAVRIEVRSSGFGL